MLPVRTRQQTDDLHWKENIYKCRYSSSFEIPIQYDGNESSAWKLKISGNKCNELFENDLIIRIGEALI